VNPLFTGSFQPPPHCIAGAATDATSPESSPDYRRNLQRNQVLFKNGKIDSIEIFSLAQLKVWSWITSKDKLTNFSYPQWCLEPMECLRAIRKKAKGRTS